MLAHAINSEARRQFGIVNKSLLYEEVCADLFKLTNIYTNIFFRTNGYVYVCLGKRHRQPQKQKRQRFAAPCWYLWNGETNHRKWRWNSTSSSLSTNQIQDPVVEAKWFSEESRREKGLTLSLSITLWRNANACSNVQCVCVQSVLPNLPKAGAKRQSDCHSSVKSARRSMLSSRLSVGGSTRLLGANSVMSKRSELIPISEVKQPLGVLYQIPSKLHIALPSIHWYTLLR